MPTDIRLYAHRGAAAELPENTLPSFRRALELGADALEMDLHMTSDGHIVVSHDPSTARMCGTTCVIRRTTLAKLQKLDAGYGFVDAEGKRPFSGDDCRIPTLDEVLEEFDVVINVDVKQPNPSMVEPLMRLLDRHNAAERVIMASFRLRTLLTARRAGYRGLTGLPKTELIAMMFTPSRLFKRLPLRGSAVQVPPSAGRFQFATSDFINRCHDLGLRVDFWTINDPEQARSLLALRADGIMTDDPKVIAPVFDQFRAAQR